MEALALLTPAQCAEILALPDLPDQEYVINKLFDHMAQPPQQHKIPEFLFYLLMFLPQVSADVDLAQNYGVFKVRPCGFRLPRSTFPARRSKLCESRFDDRMKRCS